MKLLKDSARAMSGGSMRSCPTELTTALNTPPRAAARYALPRKRWAIRIQDAYQTCEQSTVMLSVSYSSLVLKARSESSHCFK